MEIRLNVPGEPVGKARPRVTKHGVYTPDKTKDYEKKVRMCYKVQNGTDGFNPSVPLRIEILASFRVPKSFGRAKRERMVKGEILPTKKPDADNVMKSICDALNGLAYEDDKQIVEAYIRKEYAEEPCVNVLITEVEHG